jgi:hypothetical protein
LFVSEQGGEGGLHVGEAVSLDQFFFKDVFFIHCGMVLVHYKKTEHNQFLYEAPAGTPV